MGRSGAALRSATCGEETKHYHCRHKVDGSGDHVESRWGICPADCSPTVSQEQCQYKLGLYMCGDTCTDMGLPCSCGNVTLAYSDYEHYCCLPPEEHCRWNVTHTVCSSGQVVHKSEPCHGSCPDKMGGSTDELSCDLTYPCLTVAGEDVGRHCIFPFTYAGVTHHSCADWEWGGDFTGQKWCATQVT